MKEFFKKLGKKLKNFFGWVAYFLIILVWAVYDYFYQSKTHWKIFKMQLPQYIRLGAIIFALFMIFGRKGAGKKGGANGADNQADTESGAETKTEETKTDKTQAEPVNEAKDESPKTDDENDEKRQ